MNQRSGRDTAARRPSTALRIAVREIRLRFTILTLWRGDRPRPSGCKERGFITQTELTPSTSKCDL